MFVQNAKRSKRQLADVGFGLTLEVNAAESAYLDAKVDREVAEIGVTEYEKGISRQEEETLLGELRLAQSDLKRAEDAVATKPGDDGPPRKAPTMVEQLKLQRAKLVLEQGQTKLAIHRQFIRGMRLGELRAAVEKAKSVELAKQAEWECAKDKVKTVERQVARNQVSSPRRPGRGHAE